MHVGEWWVILRLEKHLPAQLDEANRQRLLNELFQNWLMTKLQQEVTYKPTNLTETPAINPAINPANEPIEAI